MPNPVNIQIMLIYDTSATIYVKGNHTVIVQQLIKYIVKTLLSQLPN